MHEPARTCNVFLRTHFGHPLRRRLPPVRVLRPSVPRSAPEDVTKRDKKLRFQKHFADRLRDRQQPIPIFLSSIFLSARPRATPCNEAKRLRRSPSRSWRLRGCQSANRMPPLSPCPQRFILPDFPGRGRRTRPTCQRNAAQARRNVFAFPPSRSWRLGGSQSAIRTPYARPAVAATNLRSVPVRVKRRRSAVSCLLTPVS
jgi:hypothetical protein